MKISKKNVNDIHGYKTLDEEAQELDKCTRTHSYCQTLILKLESDFKNLILIILCELKRLKKYAKTESSTKQKKIC